MRKLLKRMFNPDSPNPIPDSQSTITYLLNNNALDIVGINDEDDTLLYAFTPKIQDLMPELYREHLQSVHQKILAFWEKGLVELDLFSADPHVYISEAGYQADQMSQLNSEDRFFLKELKRLIENQVA